MNGKSETVTYGLKSIAFPEFFLHHSYAAMEYIVPRRITWMLGINWDVATNDLNWDEVQVFQQLDLVRKEDNLNIAKLHAISTYSVGKGIAFGTKYKLLIALCNHSAAQIQGAWRAKIINPFVASLIPPAYNKVLEMETDIKQMIYEKWE